MNGAWNSSETQLGWDWGHEWDQCNGVWIPWKQSIGWGCEWGNLSKPWCTVGGCSGGSCGNCCTASTIEGAILSPELSSCPISARVLHETMSATIPSGLHGWSCRSLSSSELLHSVVSISCSLQQRTRCCKSVQFGKEDSASANARWLLCRKLKEQVNHSLDSSNTTENERHSSSSVYADRKELVLHESVFSSFIFPRLTNKWSEFAFTRRFL